MRHAQVVAEQFGADVSNVTVTAGDTAGIALGLIVVMSLGPLMTSFTLRVFS